MVINDQVRKCVVFLAVRKISGDYRFMGTAFYVGVPYASNPALFALYLVTAKHVIDCSRGLGVDSLCIRVNRKDGTSDWVKISIQDWMFHPSEANVDVAVLPLGIYEEWDHIYFPEKLFLTPELARSNQLGIGDEVFITGLFKHHEGQTRNVPICRVGNLAALDEEQVITERCGAVDAYLIEARSIGGLSGSPVFVNFGSVRVIDGQLRHSTGHVHLLLGLIHGHFDVSKSSVDIEDGAISPAQVNTGVAIVVPYYKIKEVLDQPIFAKSRA